MRAVHRREQKVSWGQSERDQSWHGENDEGSVSAIPLGRGWNGLLPLLRRQEAVLDPSTYLLGEPKPVFEIAIDPFADFLGFRALWL